MNKTINKTATFEAIKDIVRIMIFAAASAGVVYATNKLTTLDPSSGYVVIGTAVLRFIDSWIHNNKDVKPTGLIPF